MVPAKFLVIFVLCLGISDANFLRKLLKELSDGDAEDFQDEIGTNTDSLGRELLRRRDQNGYYDDTVTDSPTQYVEDTTLSGSAEGVDDPAKEEEKLEEDTSNGGELLDHKNVDKDSTLAKLISSMDVIVHGQDQKPMGLHPESDRKQKEDSLDQHKYTPEQLKVKAVGLENDNNFKRNFETGSSRLWENGIVPYTLVGNLSNSEEKAIIEKAIEELAKKTCIQLVPKGSVKTQDIGHKSFLEFVPKTSCSSWVGRHKSGKQELTLQNPGCLHHSIVLHEILHAIGMEHEQSRSDRDKHIKIFKKNIESDGHDQFVKEHTSDTRPYDAESIMQYNLYSFGKKTGGTVSKTMELVEKKLEFLADLEAGLDFYDVADITDAYQCAAHCKGLSRPKCENGGFVDHNCKCFCPPGLKGDNCQKVETSSACGGIVDVSESKVTEIRTPNWPSPYPAGTMCTWLIKAPANMLVKLTVDNLNLPYNSLKRCYHWMEIRYNLIGQLGVKICGKIKGKTWTTTPYGESNLMMLRLDAKFAEDKDPGKGFSISTTAISKGIATADRKEKKLICTFENEDEDCFFEDDGNWFLGEGRSPSDYGPSKAYRGQFYAYVDGSNGKDHQPAKMTYKFPSTMDYCLSFAYYLSGSDMGNLRIQREDADYIYKLWTAQGNQGDSWKKAKVDIKAETGDLILIVAKTGSDYTSDIAVDDIILKDGGC
ncbi:blastula protease 10-like [Mytilus californianus]|uniref:blastula protease 10-like n=1 Tax=Mytilus californianus TaxID=6549 RepID=UPI0022465983|nr:blastula protease 10-like [Mytilus californianus]